MGNKIENVRHLCLKLKEQAGRHKSVASQGNRLSVCCIDDPLIRALCLTIAPTELLNMFEGLRRFSSVIGRAFILPTSELQLVGRRRMGWREVVGRGGGGAAALKSVWWEWSFIGWKGSQRSCKGLRTWMRGSFWNFPHRHERDELLFSARSPSLCRHIREHTHKQSCISKQTNTHSWSYTNMHSHISGKHTQTYTKTHFGFLFYLLVGKMRLGSNWSWGRLAGWAEQRGGQTNNSSGSGRKKRATAP